MKQKNIYIIGKFESVNYSIMEMIDIREDTNVFVLLPNELSSKQFNLGAKGENMIILDLQSINQNKLGIIKNIASANSKAIIIVMDQYKSEKMINTLIEAGAHGYLINNTNEYEINNTINLMFYYKDEFKNQLKTRETA